MDSAWVQYYDAFYSFKDYAKEAQDLIQLIQPHLQSGGTRWLDVACGTGKHIQWLAREFACTGLDLEDGLLAAARQRSPEIPFHQGDMRTFSLPERFDVVSCLFSAIGHMLTQEDLETAVANMTRHLRPGGVLAVEPWFRPADWHPGRSHMLTAELGEVKLVRANTSLSPVNGRITVLDFHYLIATPQETLYLRDALELRLTEEAEMRAAFEKAGLETMYEPQGITGRGLWLGRKPL